MCIRIPDFIISDFRLNKLDLKLLTILVWLVWLSGRNVYFGLRKITDSWVTSEIFFQGRYLIPSKSWPLINNNLATTLIVVTPRHVKGLVFVEYVRVYVRM